MLLRLMPSDAAADAAAAPAAPSDGLARLNSAICDLEEKVA